MKHGLILVAISGIAFATPAIADNSGAGAYTYGEVIQYFSGAHFIEGIDGAEFRPVGFENQETNSDFVPPLFIKASPIPEDEIPATWLTLQGSVSASVEQQSGWLEIGNTAYTSTYAAADLRDGTLKSASTTVLSESSYRNVAIVESIAFFNDEVRFKDTTYNASNNTTKISTIVGLEGILSGTQDPAFITGKSGFGYYLSLGDQYFFTAIGASSGGFGFYAPSSAANLEVSSGVYGGVQRDVVTAWTSGVSWTVQGDDLKIDFNLYGDEPVTNVFSYLWTGANDSSYANYSHTATFNFDLNEGASFTSRSGQFLVNAAPAVPESSSWALMLLGFASLGSVMRGHKRPRFVPCQVVSS